MVVLSAWTDPGVARSLQREHHVHLDVRLLGHGDELEAEDRPVRKGHVQGGRLGEVGLGDQDHRLVGLRRRMEEPAGVGDDRAVIPDRDLEGQDGGRATGDVKLRKRAKRLIVDGEGPPAKLPPQAAPSDPPPKRTLR